MTFKFEILVPGQQMKMNINKILLINFIIMDEFHPFIYLLNPIHIWNSSMWNHSSMDTSIHVGELNHIKF
jgi:hypothetical protein